MFISITDMFEYRKPTIKKWKLKNESTFYKMKSLLTWFFKIWLILIVLIFADNIQFAYIKSSSNQRQDGRRKYTIIAKMSMEVMRLQGDQLSPGYLGVFYDVEIQYRENRWCNVVLGSSLRRPKLTRRIEVDLARSTDRPECDLIWRSRRRAVFIG